MIVFSETTPLLPRIDIHRILSRFHLIRSLSNLEAMSSILLIKARSLTTLNATQIPSGP